MRTFITGLLKGRKTRWGISALIGAGLLLGTLLVQGGDTVPYCGKVVGQITYLDNGGLMLQETGIGTHLGNFTVAGETDENGILWFTITCASEDELYGVVAGQSGNTVELLIYDGTGRFKGASGSITATLTFDPEPVSYNPLIIGYTAIGTGTISTVGSSKE